MGMQPILPCSCSGLSPCDRLYMCSVKGSAKLRQPIHPGPVKFPVSANVNRPQLRCSSVCNFQSKKIRRVLFAFRGNIHKTCTLLKCYDISCSCNSWNTVESWNFTSAQDNWHQVISLFYQRGGWLNAAPGKPEISRYLLVLVTHKQWLGR